MFQSVQLGSKIESVGDSVQSTFVLEMTPGVFIEQLKRTMANPVECVYDRVTNSNRQLNITVAYVIFISLN